MTTFRRSTFEQRNLLLRLGIELSEPWAWITTDGTVTPQHARWRVETSEGEVTIPMDDEHRAWWKGFEYEAVGRQVDPVFASFYAEGGALTSSHAILTQWSDDLYVRLRYQRVTPAGSVLYAELVTGATYEASICGAHLKHPATDRNRAWKAMNRLLKGPQPGRPIGPVKGSEAERWMLRGREIGEEDARNEFKAETPPGRGEWERAYQWWYRHVRPRLQKPR